MKYIIISPKESTKDEVIFWRANASGYTRWPFAAGIYTQEQIDARPDYYNDGISSIAIPLTEEALTKIGFKIQVDWEAAEQFLQISKPQ